MEVLFLQDVHQIWIRTTCLIPQLRSVPGPMLVPLAIYTHCMNLAFYLREQLRISRCHLFTRWAPRKQKPLPHTGRNISSLSRTISPARGVRRDRSARTRVRHAPSWRDTKRAWQSKIREATMRVDRWIFPSGKMKISLVKYFPFLRPTRAQLKYKLNSHQTHIWTSPWNSERSSLFLLGTTIEWLANISGCIKWFRSFGR